MLIIFLNNSFGNDLNMSGVEIGRNTQVFDVTVRHALKPHGLPYAALWAIPMPQLSEEMAFVALSPICVKLHEDNKTQYLSPDNPMFVEGILKGLKARYESIHGQPFDMEDKEFSFELVDKKVNPKIITITFKKTTLLQNLLKR